MSPDRIELVRGYKPGLIASITEMHARYYAREAGLGQPFESMVASGLAEFCHRMEKPRNALWTARCNDAIVGSVAIDGEYLGVDHTALLRWFIVDDGVRGAGVGKKLLNAAMAFVDGQGFAQTHLRTFAGLSAARHLYEAQGFVLAEEKRASPWGKEILEQRLVRMRP